MAGQKLVDEMRDAIKVAIESAESMRRVGILAFMHKDCSFQLAEWKPDEAPAQSKELTELKDKPQPTLLDGFEWEPLAEED